jgi:hypothetical protein
MLTQNTQLQVALKGEWSSTRLFLANDVEGSAFRFLFSFSRHSPLVARHCSSQSMVGHVADGLPPTLTLGCKPGRVSRTQDNPKRFPLAEARNEQLASPFINGFNLIPGFHRNDVVSPQFRPHSKSEQGA